jgi:hypothetical protein
VAGCDVFFRLYYIAEGEHFNRPPIEIEANSESDAIDRAKQFIDGQDAELWCGRRLIARLSAERR